MKTRLLRWGSRSNAESLDSYLKSKGSDDNGFELVEDTRQQIQERRGADEVVNIIRFELLLLAAESGFGDSVWRLCQVSGLSKFGGFVGGYPECDIRLVMSG